MNQQKKEQIVEIVQDVFIKVGLDYDSVSTQIVPLNKIITEFPILVTELPNGKVLSTENAVKFLEKEIGFEMPELETNKKKLSGFLYVAQFGDYLQGCIFTDKSEPTVRRRFSAAHELGHYLLHFLPLLEKDGTENLFLTESLAFDEAEKQQSEIEIAQDFDFEQISIEDKFQMELEADFFAAELLMPRKACFQAIKFMEGFAEKNKKAVINYFATEFLVSYEAMKRRFEDLGVI